MAERNAGRDATCARIQVLGDKARDIMERLPADSPLRSAAFSMAALAGELQALLRANDAGGVPAGDASDPEETTDG